jgi:quinolinate synthase
MAHQMTTSEAGRSALRERVSELRHKRRAVILAHLYQRPEIQDLADYVGDSLGLARQAAAADADVIVFCGVHFMAESAAILSPDRIVLLPEPRAGCPMADMVDPDELAARKAELPGVPVVCYVNSSAAVKAQSDICCTSRNAVDIVNSLGVARVLFVPDRNLGHYISTQTSTEIILWDGYCASHDSIRAAEVRRVKEAHPEALVLAHPECRPDVVRLADHVLSTSGMLRTARESDAQEFIICTEQGILHPLTRQNPGKKFYLPCPAKQYCANMKKTTIEKLVASLERLEPRVTVPEAIRAKASRSLERMLAVSSRSAVRD